MYIQRRHQGRQLQFVGNGHRRRSIRTGALACLYASDDRYTWPVGVRVCPCVCVHARSCQQKQKVRRWLQVMGGDLKCPVGHYVMERPKVVNRQQPNRRAFLFFSTDTYRAKNNSRVLSAFLLLIEKISNMIITPISVHTLFGHLCF